MQHVFHARQIHSLLTSQELNHANPPDIVFGVAPAVRSRSLWLDQILALVNHQGAGMEAEDLAGDTGGENRPPGGNRRHPLSFSHITPARSIPRPRIPVTLYSRYHLLLTGASLLLHDSRCVGHAAYSKTKRCWRLSSTPAAFSRTFIRSWRLIGRRSTWRPTPPAIGNASCGDPAGSSRDSQALRRPRARCGWHRREMDSKPSSTRGAAANRWWLKRLMAPASR